MMILRYGACVPGLLPASSVFDLERKKLHRERPVTTRDSHSPREAQILLYFEQNLGTKRYIAW